MPSARRHPFPSFLPAGLARSGPYCPRPRRIIRRTVWKARRRAALSVLGVVAIVGAVAAGGVWLLREPVLAAGAGDTMRGAESLLSVPGGEAMAAPIAGDDGAVGRSTRSASSDRAR